MFSTGIFWLYAGLLGLVVAHFNPFMDSIPFRINWPGPVLESDTLETHATVTMKTKDNEKYQCVLPDKYDDDVQQEDHLADYDGLSEEDLLAPLFKQTSCSYRIESYWSYELCHGKHMRQYNERKEMGKKLEVIEYFLGKYLMPTKDANIEPDKIVQTAPESATEPSQKRQIRKKRIENIELAYFEYNYTNGTPCDLTKKSRRVSIHYICQPEGNGEIYELKETSTCEYEITVLTHLLCKHPGYKPKDTPVTSINCHPIEGSPARPKSLINQDLESLRQYNGREITRSNTDLKDVVSVKVVDTRPQDSTIPPQSRAETRTVLSPQTDTQLLKEFLHGDYCLHGGVGWWKHEFCFGRFVQQYHEEKGTKTTVMLGVWNHDKHLEWLSKFPSKRHKPGQKVLHLYFSNGEICDLTGQPRNVEVKLRCKANEKQPHAVSLYLLEPNVCEYVLGIESPILCDVIDKADENGIVRNIDVHVNVP